MNIYKVSHEKDDQTKSWYKSLEKIKNCYSRQELFLKVKHVDFDFELTNINQCKENRIGTIWQWAWKQANSLIF